MKSAVRWLVAFLLFRALYSGEITYTLLNNTIKSFPHDIPQNVNKIVVQKTQITEIDYIEPFPNLTKMFIGKNALTKFPDLTNVSNSLQKCFLSQNDISVVDFFPKMKALQVLAIGSNKLTRLPDLTNISNTLEELYLENNQIIVVDGIPPMSVLKILKLSENRLTEFPDLRNAGSTLQELNLFENNITSFAEPLLRPMVALEILHLGAEYVMFPNVCAMGSSEKPLIIQLYSNQTICDLRAAYTKLAIETGRLVMEPTTWISSLICVEPGHLSGRLFSEVNIAEMVDTTNIIYRKLGNVTDWGCPLETSGIYKGQAIHCAVYCSRRQTCLMFVTDNDSCILKDSGHLSTSNNTDLDKAIHYRI